MTRELALGVLMEVFENGGYSNVVLHNTLMKYQYMEKQNRAFLTRLCEGVIERQIQLDYVIDQFSKIKCKKMKPVIRNLLRMGTYQILFMEQVPDSAACNESVKLAAKKGFVNLKGFVNGVLRNISRKKDLIQGDFFGTSGTLEYLSVMYSIPLWILKLWEEEYSYEQIEKICQGFFAEKTTSIRVNTEKTTPEELSKELLEENITVSEGIYVPYALHISNYNYVAGLRSFQEGKFQVQDESSMLIAIAAGIKKGNTILDVCAAPGGKSTHAAQLLAGSGQVIARDLTEQKALLIRENIERLGLKNVEVQVQDARVMDDTMREKADIVIADLPCSGLGVLKRKGDIKYKTKEEDIKALAKLQREILKTVADYVKPGGTLIYSTCTINHYENLDNVKWILSNLPFETESLCPYLSDSFSEKSMEDGYLQLLPGIHETDGFFLARFRKA